MAALLGAALLFAGCEQFTDNSSADPITYTAEADGINGADTSSIINFEFSKAVADLTAYDISVTDGTGSVTKGELTGSGITWTLAITVTTAGNVKVSINKTGIEAAEKDVAVHKAGEAVGTTYTAAANGTNNSQDSTTITLTFSEAVTDLAADDITVTTGTGSVTKGELSGSGTTWTLGITVVTAGNVKVSINKTGIDGAEKTVTVFKADETVDITYTVTGTAGDGTTTGIVFTFSGEVTDLAADDISVADDTGSVTKGELSGSETTWTLAITVVTAGNVKVSISKDGIEAGEKDVTVVKAEGGGDDGPFEITSAVTGIMAKGGERQFNVNTAAAVTWSVSGALDGDGEDTKSEDTTISSSGQLTIGADETNITLKVTAASTGNPQVTDTKEVKVKGWRTINLYDLFISGNAGAINGIAYGNGKWVAVGLKGKIAYSVDGESWEAAESPATEDFSKVIYDGPAGGKKFIAIGGKNAIAY